MKTSRICILSSSIRYQRPSNDICLRALPIPTMMLDGPQARRPIMGNMPQKRQTVLAQLNYQRMAKVGHWRTLTMSGTVARHIIWGQLYSTAILAIQPIATAVGAVKDHTDKLGIRLLPAFPRRRLIRLLPRRPRKHWRQIETTKTKLFST